MSRPTKERLEKLRQIPDDEYYKRVHPKPWLGEAVRDLFAEIDALTADLEAAYRQGRVDQAKEDANIVDPGFLAGVTCSDCRYVLNLLEQRAAELEREGKDK